MTEDEALELLHRVAGRSRVMDLYPFQYGWAAQPRLSEEELAKGMGVGLGVLIVDREGIVTAHRSLPPKLIMEEYSEARRQGRIAGREVWPNPAPDRRPTTLDPRGLPQPKQPQPRPGPRPPFA